MCMYICVRSLAHLGRHVARAGCETSCRADASAAAAPWASAIGDRGLWLLVPLVKLLLFPEAALWLAEGLKWAASARIILMTDFRLPSTMSAGREGTVHSARYKNRWTNMIQQTWIDYTQGKQENTKLHQCFWNSKDLIKWLCENVRYFSHNLPRADMCGIRMCREEMNCKTCSTFFLLSSLFCGAV